MDSVHLASASGIGRIGGYCQWPGIVTFSDMFLGSLTASSGNSVQSFVLRTIIYHYCRNTISLILVYGVMLMVYW